MTVASNAQEHTRQHKGMAVDVDDSTNSISPQTAADSATAACQDLGTKLLKDWQVPPNIKSVPAKLKDYFYEEIKTTSINGYPKDTGETKTTESTPSLY